MNRKYFILSLVLGFSTLASADVKIGVFDAQVVLDSIEDGKSAAASLKREAEDKKKLIETRGKELEKIQKELETQTLVLSKEAKEKKEMEFQNKFKDFQKLQMEAQQDMQKKEMTMTGDIFKKINQVIQKMGNDTGYDFIFEKNQGAVTYFKSGDLTNQVIAEYNKTFGKAPAKM